MKKAYKLLVAAFSLVLCSGLQACHNNEEVPHGYPILFRCADVTRAETTVTTLQNDPEGFDVYAYFEANGSEFKFNKNVIYKDGVWGYTGDIEYWLPGATYWFKAVYPKGLGTIDNSSSAMNLTISNYSIADQTDILVATADELVVNSTIGAPDTGSVVNLTFQHLLANVVIKIKAEVNVTINEVTLKYVPIKCNYTDNNWSPSAQGNMSQEDLNASLSPAADPAEFGFLAFPQSANGVKLFIRTSDKDYEIPIPTITWNAGVKYTYTLTIKQNDILFDEPTVEEWDEESAVGSVVIK